MTNQNERLNRREFLRLAGIATAGTAVLAGCSGGAESGSDVGAFPGGNISFAKEVDVVVIGAGGAGLWGTYELVKAGYKPLVVEKNPSWGGDTILACGVLPVHGTKVQEAQGIEDTSPEESWNAVADRYATNRVPELSRIVYMNSARAIDIWYEEFGIEFMEMDPNSYTKFFHIPAPGMQNDHKLFEPLYDYAAENGAEFMFDTRATNFIINEKDEPVGLRVRDEITGVYQDIRFKKVLISTGDWVSNQEMIARFLPQWTNVSSSTYSSMGEGIQMAQSLGADTVNMDQEANLMSNFAPTVVWGFYDSLIHIYPDGNRICNENAIFNAPGGVHSAGDTFWWTIFGEELTTGYHHTSYNSRANRGDIVSAETIEELAEKLMVPVANLQATIEKYNADAEAGEDTVFAKRVAFKPISAPYYACKNVVVRYKTSGGLKINEQCQVLNRADTPIPNVYAAGSCQGETTPNVHDVSAIGMHAGQMIAEALKSA